MAPTWYTSSRYLFQGICNKGRKGYVNGALATYVRRAGIPLLNNFLENIFLKTEILGYDPKEKCRLWMITFSQGKATNNL